MGNLRQCKVSRVVLDLDQTLIHALSGREMPANAAELSERLVDVPLMTLDFKIAVRKGATRLIETLRRLRISLAFGTCNLFAREILAHIAGESPAWRDIPVHVFESRQHGSKSLDELDHCTQGAPHGADAAAGGGAAGGGGGHAHGHTLIFDDQPGAWCEHDRKHCFQVPSLQSLHPRAAQSLEPREEDGLGMAASGSGASTTASQPLTAGSRSARIRAFQVRPYYVDRALSQDEVVLEHGCLDEVGREDDVARRGTYGSGL